MKPLTVLTLFIIGAVVVLVAGCGASMPADPTHMSPEQLTAMAKDRSASGACTVFSGPWGVGRTIYVQLDKATIPSGSVTIGTDCTVTITADPAVAKNAAAARALNAVSAP